ncbi:MAG: 2-isopropylmalate synthase [Alphaproteobacteria bacterium]|jgi:2-isopropylmalate synthase|nr:2-isopropylmalate synthase [Alphaproteobacteria bacterium]
MKTDKVIIFDTTLRDGEQALMSSLSKDDKLKIALKLEELGVDVIEAGFPVSSQGDFESVSEIAKAVKNSTVCGLCRAVEKDIDVCAESLSVADNFRIHTFIATSPIHTETKLKKDYNTIIDMAVKAVKRAKTYTDDVEFSCEDAGRTPIDDLCKIVEAVISAGATTVNIPDTVGYTVPSEFGNIIKQVFDRVPNINDAIISVHCHNDLGLATANSIAAVEAGARQVEVTINGIGERAGNCALEEIAMIIKTRKNMLNVETSINSEKIYEVSQMVSRICDMPIQPNKAIVGARAFSHSSGIHQDGVIKGDNVYEIMTPKSIGKPTEKLNLTSRSGRAAVNMYMEGMGYSDYDLNTLYSDFIALADKKGQVFDYDLEILYKNKKLFNDKRYFEIISLNVETDSEYHTANILIRCGDEEKTVSAKGEGSVSCLYNAIYDATGYKVSLEEFDISSKVEKGKDSAGKTRISVRFEDRVFYGSSLSEDIIVSAGEALIDAMNSIYLWKSL